MQKKEQFRFDSPQVEKKEVEVVEAKKPLIYLGVATTNLIVDSGSLEQGDEVGILEDKGGEWLTEKGLVSKLFLLLKEV